MPNVDTLLRDHVRLQVDCIDRLYLNGYVARLQRPQNLWWFLHEHRGCPVVSPALLKKWVDAFVGDIKAFAERHRIPVVHFARGARFFRAWLRRLPHPFTAADRRAGHRYQLSILQMEVSLTQVFDRPLHGRQFLEEVIRDNLDVGRPDRVQLLFERRVTRQTPGSFRTRVLMDGVQPTLRFDYKHTRVKQYFKLCRALRTETTFNDAYDFDIGRSLGNLPRLRTLGHHINHRLLSLERVAQHCAIASQTVERIVLPTVDDGQRVPALRWGDPRTMALFSAVCAFAFTPEGFTNQTLRQRVGALHDPGPRGYTPGRMTYDLRRLRRKGLILRLHGTHRYQLTPLGRRVALFMAKSYARLVRPPSIASTRPCPTMPTTASAPAGEPASVPSKS